MWPEVSHLSSSSPFKPYHASRSPHSVLSTFMMTELIPECRVPACVSVTRHPDECIFRLLCLFFSSSLVSLWVRVCPVWRFRSTSYFSAAHVPFCHLCEALTGNDFWVSHSVMICFIVIVHMFKLNVSHCQACEAFLSLLKCLFMHWILFILLSFYRVINSDFSFLQLPLWVRMK